ncbi:MAG: hypothetical protein ACO1OQ_11535 [Rufibacter sp.]
MQTENLYRYLGDRQTQSKMKGALCQALRRKDGKCIRGKNGSMLVRFIATGETAVVVGRLLRKVPSAEL